MCKNSLRLSLKISLIFFISVFTLHLTYKELQYPFVSSQWFILPNIPYPVKGHVAVNWKFQDTNFIIIAGGRTNGTTTNTVLKINTITNAYTYLKPLPIPLERAGGFVLKDSLFIIGGSVDTGSAQLNSVFVYNLKDTVWRVKNNFPVAISNITSSTISLNDTTAFVAGGRTGVNVLNTVYRYFSRTDSWIPISPIPNAGAYDAGLVCLTDTTLLFVGGRNSSTAFPQIYKGIVNRTNPLTVTWNLSGTYPIGPVYGLACKGSKIGRAVFTCGSNSFLTDSPDAVLGETFLYTEPSGVFQPCTIKPTPVMTTQVDGYITPLPGNINVITVFAAGGAPSANGNGVNAFEKLIIIDSSLINSIKPVNEIPLKNYLYQNYPNPFNPATSIKFQVVKNGFVTVKIYNIIGKEIVSLVNGYLNTGTYSVTFNGENFSGGIYFCKLEVLSKSDNKEFFRDIKKMVLVK